MDAAEEERDVKVQRAASGLLADFEGSLKPFLWRTLGDGKLRIRKRVRHREAERLLRLLAPLQELPQLLDPHLEKFLPVLGTAYLECLRTASPLKKQIKHATLLMPLSTAICQLLYTFCKIRGEKVIVRFLSTETRHLELLLSAIEAAEINSEEANSRAEKDSSSTYWAWEERYVCLLWLSHLLLAPFDLATISSAGTADIERPEIPSLVWPENLPGVALRVVPLAIKHLAAAGKERDAAKALLVRISMRKDMQELGLLHALVEWSLSQLQNLAVKSANSTYSSVGVLSYIAGVLVSSTNTSDMDPYLLKIFRVVQDISSEENAAFKSIQTSALARKTVIKVLRTVSVLALRGKGSASQYGVETTEIVETTISYLLEALADNDTPVRLAASKALSVITLKLPRVMAAQVVEAVLDSLNHSILWTDEILGEDKVKVRDLSAVNPLEWHGLILTLSHLLYRRSPPADSLSDILHALLIGLSFERRTTSGSSIGTNVRDAACFGIWALARRYTTVELQCVVPSSVFAAKRHNSSSIIQVLATELVVAASLDPEGNIRRGASAALQELIGRHPDTVAEGISVVQIVDYHAVALRSRAMLEVASGAALLSIYYEDALLDAFFAWRGVGDGDATSRRNAGTGVGLLANSFSEKSPQLHLQKVVMLLQRIEKQLGKLKSREIDLQHGLLLSMASVISSLTAVLSKSSGMSRESHANEARSKAFNIVKSTLQATKSSTYRRPELVAEGVSRLLQATIPLLKVGSLDPLTEIIPLAEDLLNPWLRRSDKNDAIAAATEAAIGLVSIVNQAEHFKMIENWIREFSDYNVGRVPTGYSLALTAVFPTVEDGQKDQICRGILEQWQRTHRVESRITILQSLTSGAILDSHTSQFINLIAEGLDDYTTDGRGDIGSLVRVEALKAARKVFSLIPYAKAKDGVGTPNQWYSNIETFSVLYGKVLRLSAEKLDRVRIDAQLTLAEVCRNKDARLNFEHFSVSSFEYFRWLLDLQIYDWLNLPFLIYAPSQWRIELFEGLVTSADTGSEDLIRVSRAALAEFCELGELKVESSPSPGDACHFVCEGLYQVAKKNITNDRVLVPTLEAMSFLFDVGIMQRSKLQWRSLYVLVQKSHYKTGNVRKLEAAIKIYGGLVQVYPEALEKLTSMLLHPFPKLRNHVADVLFVAKGVGKGVNWTKAGKDDMRRLKEEMDLGERL